MKYKFRQLVMDEIRDEKPGHQVALAVAALAPEVSRLDLSILIVDALNLFDGVPYTGKLQMLEAWVIKKKAEFGY